MMGMAAKLLEQSVSMGVGLLGEGDKGEAYVTAKMM